MNNSIFDKNIQRKYHIFLIFHQRRILMFFAKTKIKESMTFFTIFDSLPHKNRNKVAERPQAGFC